MLDHRDLRLLADFLSERTIDFDRFVLESSAESGTIEEAEAEAAGILGRLHQAASAADPASHPPQPLAQA